MPALSVIIPTYRRSEILAKCLEHLGHQTIAKDLEVIVVSDGPDEATAALFGKQGNMSRTPATLNIRLIEITKSHQGTARNIGVAEANAPHCLFIGDDIFLFPDACEQHIRTHKKCESLSLASKQAVLGFTTWDPLIEITPVMRWLEKSGWQFGYEHVAPFAHAFLPTASQHLYAYTSHISLPTAVARNIPFLANVTLYGWEDIEWGMRLAQNNVAIYYEPLAKAWHHHSLTMGQSLRRMETLGRAAIEMKNIAPDFDRIPDGFKKWMYEASALLPTMAGRHRAAFMRGIRKAKRAEKHDLKM